MLPPARGTAATRLPRLWNAPKAGRSRRWHRERWRRAAACGLMVLAAACRPSPASTPDETPASRSEPVTFGFPPTGDDAVNSETTRGRATILVFITTFDLVSQLLVRRVGEVIVRFRPRANAAAVVLEAPQYAELLSAYRESLSLPFPVVMADFATQQGRGHFGGITQVPTTVVLDRAGAEIWRHQGPLEVAEIEAALRRASSSTAPR